ncbi:MAG: glycosyltransferase family 2 protein [Clostridia bacterium]|nr:glycosyltransferase family 2 protein [Clostridia bacterium]
MNYFILALSVALKLFSVWFVIIALFTLKKPKPIPESPARTRFACLVAARNEQNVISDIVSSLRAQDYPDEMYDIFVIPNNCTDDTRGRAIAAGAQIIDCPGEIRCKGDALHVAVDKLLHSDYDAFCVFDADNIVDPGFLSHMNNAFCAGARVAKAAIRVKNPYDSATAGCYGLYFALFDTFFSRPRMALGLSSKLVGTGFAVRRELITQMGGWNTQTIAEDAEFSAQCVEMGERVWFVPEAVTYDEAPRDFRTTLIQRRRWCSGLMDVARARFGTLWRTFCKKPSVRALDMLAFLCYPFTYVASLIPSLMSAVAAVAENRFLSYIIIAFAWLGVAYVGCAAFGVLLAHLAGMNDRRAARSIVLFPIFMASWLPLQVISLFKRECRWRPIAHAGCKSVVESQ